MSYCTSAHASGGGDVNLAGGRKPKDSEGLCSVSSFGDSAVRRLLLGEFTKPGATLLVEFTTRNALLAKFTGSFRRPARRAKYL